MQKVDLAAGSPGFNSCLLNLYRHGHDCVGWHADNERLYGPDPTIGSVSFGECREFLLRK
jgi:alkylated DNA repair dioxygenase AlkB